MSKASDTRKVRRKEEHQSQAMLFRYLDVLAELIPGLAFAFASKNDFKRTGTPKDFGVWNYLKAEGVKPGVPDLFIPIARSGFHGLFIEMKAEGGSLSDNQEAYRVALLAEGYRVDVCYGFDEARKVVDEYFAEDLRKPVRVDMPATGGAVRKVGVGGLF